MAETGSFKVHGREYNLPTDLTMGEMCDAEKEFGVEFGNTERSGVRMASAMMWIAIRRVDPSVTVDDIRSLPIDVFESMEAGADAGPPELSSTSETPSISGDVSSLNGGHLEEAPDPIGAHG